MKNNLFFFYFLLNVIPLWSQFFCKSKNQVLTIHSSDSLFTKPNLNPYSIELKFQNNQIDYHFANHDTNAQTVAKKPTISNGWVTCNGLFVDQFNTMFLGMKDAVWIYESGDSIGKIYKGGQGIGTNPNQMYDVQELTIDSLGNLFLVDQNAVYHWKRNDTIGKLVAGKRTSLRSVNHITQLDTLNIPESIFLYQDSFLLIADIENHRIVKWKIYDTIGSIAAGGNGKGTNLNQLNYPPALFVKNDSIYIADIYNNRIVRWAEKDTVGILIAGNGTKGIGSNQLNNPSGIFIDGWRNIYICDANNNRIQKWRIGDTSGITIAGDKNGDKGVIGDLKPNLLWKPTDVALNCDGDLYVWDHDNYRIQKFNSIISKSFKPKQEGLYHIITSFYDGSVIDDSICYFKNKMDGFLGNDTLICDNKWTIHPNVQNADSAYKYTWNNGGNQASIIINKSGQYTCTLSVNQCIVIDTIHVNFEYPSEYKKQIDKILDCEKNPITVDLTNGKQNTYFWSDNRNDSIRNLIEMGIYEYEIINKCGNFKDTFQVFHEDCNCTFKLPQIFSPNGDNINDNWYPNYTCKIGSIEFSIIIMNRWGEIVFIGNNQNSQWDGSFKGIPQPIGTYIVQINFKENNQNKMNQTAITLVR